MEASTGKEGILKNIRKALTQPVDQPFPGIEKINFAFEKPDDDLSVLFAERVSSLLGKFSFCANEEDLVNQIRQLVLDRGWTEVHCADENIKGALSSFGFPAFSEMPLGDVDVSIKHADRADPCVPCCSADSVGILFRMKDSHSRIGHHIRHIA